MGYFLTVLPSSANKSKNTLKKQKFHENITSSLHDKSNASNYFSKDDVFINEVSVLEDILLNNKELINKSFVNNNDINFKLDNYDLMNNSITDNLEVFKYNFTMNSKKTFNLGELASQIIEIDKLYNKNKSSVLHNAVIFNERKSSNEGGTLINNNKTNKAGEIEENNIETSKNETSDFNPENGTVKSKTNNSVAHWKVDYSGEKSRNMNSKHASFSAKTHTSRRKYDYIDYFIG